MVCLQLLASFQVLSIWKALKCIFVSTTDQLHIGNPCSKIPAHWIHLICALTYHHQEVFADLKSQVRKFPGSVSGVIWDWDGWLESGCRSSTMSCPNDIWMELVSKLSLKISIANCPKKIDRWSSFSSWRYPRHPRLWFSHYFPTHGFPMFSHIAIWTYIFTMCLPSISNEYSPCLPTDLSWAHWKRRGSFQAGRWAPRRPLPSDHWSSSPCDCTSSDAVHGACDDHSYEQ